MKLSSEIKTYIDRSVLCWLATASEDNIPNVSPKEIFNYYGNDEIIIANIASPNTVRNIKKNTNVCISFIDILIQKGYQIHGKAMIIEKEDSLFLERAEVLSKMTKGLFPFETITTIKIITSKPIIAPKYILYPETTETEQINSAKKTYGF
ncbi:pyridoxamine 5'-phosphate oxidase family protein [Olleya sp. YS]|uniref:pyridoxamine 5'-phosphate oxidase family protein n=1 Tax=Olleya sp. YS TaxID=3028318 RepID=UPI00243417FA|nr:pyridoxamine 5'-phosphate oxidase family protein [Olleya sp. YS]WGD33572.1 pyridoxamine 5'-phosphate oxidase family protein [Olleya sp. YS]